MNESPLSESGPDKAEQVNAFIDELDRASEMVARMGVVKDRMVTLEVDCIAAESASRFRHEDTSTDITVETAAAIVLTSDRVREAAKRFEDLGPLAGVNTTPLEEAGDALRAWLDAETATHDQRFSSMVRGALMVFSLIGIAAGVLVHWSFLILLMPVGGVSALMWSGNDSSWKRLGAKKRYQLSQVSEPASWTENDVQQRLQLLDEELQQHRQRASRPVATQQVMEASIAEIDELNSELDLLLASVGLERDELDSQLERQLRVFSEAYIAKTELRALRSELARLEGESETIRNRVYRYLHREGQAPAGGDASLDELRKGLGRLAV